MKHFIVCKFKPSCTARAASIIPILLMGRWAGNWFPERLSDVSRVVWQDSVRTQFESRSGWLQVQCTLHPNLPYPTEWEWKKGGNKLLAIF